VISESGWHQKTWVLQQRYEQVSFEYAGGDLIGFLSGSKLQITESTEGKAWLSTKTHTASL